METHPAKQRAGRLTGQTTRLLSHTDDKKERGQEEDARKWEILRDTEAVTHGPCLGGWGGVDIWTLTGMLDDIEELLLILFRRGNDIVVMLF